jgi:hypothetical protein
MAEVWALLDPTSITNNGREWVLHLLLGRSELDRTRILMVLWRIWHVRNEVVHLKPAPPVEASRRFLCSYLESIMTIKYYPQDDFIKVKARAVDCFLEQPTKLKRVEREEAMKRRWSLPPNGWGKLNVDGSFTLETHSGCAGMILRDEQGESYFPLVGSYEVAYHLLRLN